MNHDIVTDPTTATVDRRRFLKLAVGVGAAALTVDALGRTAGAQEIEAAGTGYLRTTTSVRLRTGPGLRRRILLEIPGNATVTDLGVTKNGFRNVIYQGTTGWAWYDYFAVSNGGGTGDPVITGAAVTSTAVNLRSGPSTGNTVLSVLAKGTRVETSDTVRNGYRYVVADNLPGWVVDGALEPFGNHAPDRLTTTSALNLRAEPSTSARVLAVMPAGTVVTPTGNGSGRFAQVVYGRLTGWAHVDYLN